MPRDVCISHLKKAMAYHHTYKLDAMNGRGADRHMFGLYVASKFLGIKPKIFEFKVRYFFEAKNAFVVFYYRGPSAATDTPGTVERF